MFAYFLIKSKIANLKFLLAWITVFVHAFDIIDGNPEILSKGVQGTVTEHHPDHLRMSAIAQQLCSTCSTERMASKAVGKRRFVPELSKHRGNAVREESFAGDLG